MIRALLLVLAVVCATGTAEGQEAWQVEEPADTTAGGTGTAFSENEEGYRFSVATGPSRYSADCRLTLPDESSDSIDVEYLVSVRIDANKPQTVLRWQGLFEEDEATDFFEVIRRTAGGVPRTGVDQRWVAFRCWPALRSQESPATGILRELLDGSELVVRFATVEGGPQAVAFSLAGAREAIAGALQISATPSPMDIAQAELLRFRFDYRSNTCYLLGRRKRQKRCLEAVSRCAEQVHDSVLSMQECIEAR